MSIPRLSIVFLILCLSGCADDESGGSPGHETELTLRRADGAGGAVAVGARARLSVSATPCLTDDCSAPRVDGPVEVTLSAASAQVVGEQVLEGGTARFEIVATAAGPIQIDVVAPTQLGERTASFTVDFADVTTVTTTPICGSELGGQEPLESRLATQFAMAAETSMMMEVDLRDAGGTLLTGFGLDAIGVGQGFSLTPPSEEGGAATLAATGVGEAEVTPLVGTGNGLTVRAYTFDEVDGFLFVTQVGDAEAMFVGDRSAAVGDSVRVEMLPTIRTDIGCTLPFDAKYAVTTPEICTLDGDGVVIARWASVTAVAAGTCTVSVALTNANGRGHTETLDIEIQ